MVFNGSHLGPEIEQRFVSHSSCERYVSFIVGRYKKLIERARDQSRCRGSCAAANGWLRTMGQFSSKMESVV